MKQASLPQTKQVTPVPSTKIDKEAKKRERQIRRAIEELEGTLLNETTEIERLETQLCEPEVFADHQKVAEIQKALDSVKATHEEHEMTWLELQEQLEEIAQ